MKKCELEAVVRLRRVARNKIQKIQDDFKLQTGGSITISSAIEKACDSYLKEFIIDRQTNPALPNDENYSNES